MITFVIPELQPFHRRPSKAFKAVSTVKIRIRKYLKNLKGQLLIKYGFVSLSVFIVVLCP